MDESLEKVLFLFVSYQLTHRNQLRKENLGSQNPGWSQSGERKICSL